MRATRKTLLTVLLFIVCFSFLGAEIPKLGATKSGKPTICLNMIVKNESHVITRCIDSVLPLIDTWVIVDTGSTDGTQKIIVDYMKKLKVPGDLVERPWVNFGHNREEALVLAKKKADYVLFMDADDILKYEEGFKLPDLIADSYLIASNCGGMEYFIPRLVKSEKDWHWEGVLHEYVTAADALTRETLGGVEYIYICDGARAKDPEKYKKDVKILQEALAKEPDNARYMFYLAQSYGSGGDFKNAIEHYQKRIDMGGWPEEVFWSMLQIARLQERLEEDPKVIEESYVKALKYRPTRPEPFFYLATRARQNNDFKKGYKLTKLAVDMPHSTDTLFLEKWTYDAILFEYSLCAYYVGEYDESLKACDRLLAMKNLMPEYREHTIINRQYALEKVQELTVMKSIDRIFDDSISQVETTSKLKSS